MVMKDGSSMANYKVLKPMTSPHPWGQHLPFATAAPLLRSAGPGPQPWRVGATQTRAQVDGLTTSTWVGVCGGTMWYHVAVAYGQTPSTTVWKPMGVMRKIIMIIKPSQLHSKNIALLNIGVYRLSI